VREGSRSTKLPSRSVPSQRESIRSKYNRGMKWFVGLILLVALALSGYAVYKAKQIQSDAKPKTRPITAVAR
jgi:hypothetical protein